MKSIINAPSNLRLLADFLDGIDAAIQYGYGKEFSDEVQQDLRNWAAFIEYLVTDNLFNKWLIAKEEAFNGQKTLGTNREQNTQRTSSNAANAPGCGNS